ncbi:MAG: hypothetical protein AAGE52_01435 [Myxococcota bacterium]
MPRKLPPGVRLRDGVYYVYYRGPSGRQVEESAGADKRTAVAFRRKRVEEVQAGTWRPRSSSGVPTVREYWEQWAPRRKRERRSGETDVGNIRRHVLPELGDMRLDEIRPKHVADLVAKLKATMKPKYVRNVHGSLSAMLADARFHEVIIDNPAKGLPRGILPRPARRGERPFHRGEAITLITDARIPEDRRVLAALCCLAGVRPGEACGRRWRDILEGDPLPRLHVTTQYQDAPLKGARDDYTAERLVPVHPTLAQILSDWWAEGWGATYGRAPKPADFICPDHRDLRMARTKNQYSKALTRDQKRLGLDASVGLHSGRRFFITQCRQGGAQKDVVDRITHDPKGDILDLYTYWDWETLSRAVLCLRLDLREAEVTSIAGGNAGEGSLSMRDHGGGAGNRTAGPSSVGKKSLRKLPHPALRAALSFPSVPSGARTMLGSPSIRCPECAGELREWRCTDCGLLVDSEVG